MTSSTPDTISREPIREPIHEPIHVVVLAGGQNTIPLYDGYVPGPKALISYNGKTSLEYVLDALFAVPGIEQICIEGPQAALHAALAHRRMDTERVTFAEGGETFLDSLVVGLEHFRASRTILFVTADLPLLAPRALEDFLAGCRESRAAETPAPSIHIAAVPRDSYTGDFLHFTKPFNHFRDIQICHGNLFLVDTDLLEKPEIRERVTKLYDGRKSVLSRLAFGWQVALSYLIGVDLLHVLTLSHMAEIASRHLGVDIVPVLIAHPEVTMDVDEADDYRFVRDRILRETGRAEPEPETETKQAAA